MQWDGEGLLIGVRRHGETSVIAEVMVAKKGRTLGLIRGGRSTKLAATLQAGIALGAPGDTIEVDPGTYSGPGNRDLDFGGKALVLRSVAGAAVTILDCQASGRGLVFQTGEGHAAIVEGFTITGKRRFMLSSGASPTRNDLKLGTLMSWNARIFLLIALLRVTRSASGGAPV